MLTRYKPSNLQQRHKYVSKLISTNQQINNFANHLGKIRYHHYEPTFAKELLRLASQSRYDPLIINEDCVPSFSLFFQCLFRATTSSEIEEVIKSHPDMIYQNAVFVVIIRHIIEHGSHITLVNYLKSCESNFPKWVWDLIWDTHDIPQKMFRLLLNVYPPAAEKNYIQLGLVLKTQINNFANVQYIVRTYPLGLNLDFALLEAMQINNVEIFEFLFVHYARHLKSLECAEFFHLFWPIKMISRALQHFNPTFINIITQYIEIDGDCWINVGLKCIDIEDEVDIESQRYGLQMYFLVNSEMSKQSLIWLKEYAKKHNLAYVEEYLESLNVNNN
jgi:hypothetical protein